ncbi:MAG TPA: hypothetical protein PLO37_18110 [Candidatus Hydrogenedentes bacterium]|nr:hypothetical protein [Candidatus Hydrogenedentota bacterium]HPG68766.1 hypothetical protein [Candidatus Hydrogenedentota bacterium]
MAASAGLVAGTSFEERALLAQAPNPAGAAASSKAARAMPCGKIKDVTISRLICGGNLISGFAHSRDLIYVSQLLEHYFTDEKVMETFDLVGAEGVNTAILRYDSHTLRILNTYWHDRGGELQWIAQVKPTERDLFTDIDHAVDNGATGVYIQGGVGDEFVKKGRVELLGKALEHIQENEVIGGIGAHRLEVVVECEKAGIKPDFYMKTLNSKSYWSAGPAVEHDNVWARTPEETIEFMKTVECPWIAFKVLGAGAIHPKEGFRYAFENGADFICVGMFDFQVAEDADIARALLAQDLGRARTWRA